MIIPVGNWFDTPKHLNYFILHKLLFSIYVCINIIMNFYNIEEILIVKVEERTLLLLLL